MHYDLIIKNGILVTPQDNSSLDIAVSGGKIIKKGILDASDTADEIYDAKGKHVLPGIIDAHVHFRDPGLTEKEDFETGSIAAAMGGITMIADMPNVIPVTCTIERFNEKVLIAREKSYIDFALFALLNNDNLNEMEGLKKAGALGYKVFLGTSTGEIAAPSPAILEQQMIECQKLNMRIGLHCETSDLNTYHTSVIRKNDTLKAGEAFSLARPVFSETLAVQTALCYSQNTQAKIMIHHVTCKDAALLVAEAKQKGINVKAETCPHYLLFNCESHSFRVYPPIRSETCRKTLWDSLKNGTIDMIATDHAPHTAEEKKLPVWEVPAGLNSVETSVQLMLNEVNNGKLTLNEYVSLASENPAKIWGIYPRKGSMEPGTDADFTIVDMNKVKQINENELYSKSKTSPYNGKITKGSPEATIVRGVFVMKDGILTGKKGYAEFISPEL